jgi:hypothetical protein
MSTVSSSPVPLPAIRASSSCAQRARCKGMRRDPSVSSAPRSVVAQVRLPELAELVRHLEVVARYGWRPTTRAVSPTHPPTISCASPAWPTPTTTGRLGGSARGARREPGIGRATVHARPRARTPSAAMLAGPPALAARGGPYRWEPLMPAYASRSERHRARTVAASGRCSRHGADPNVGYCGTGCPRRSRRSPAFGRASRTGSPAAGHSVALGRALLAAGADPNDPRRSTTTLFGDDDDHLVLLFEFGLGRGRRALRERLGGAIDPPRARAWSAAVGA